MSVFGQVWLWSLAAFVLGALLTWLLLVRPARARVRELERRVVAHRAEPVAVPADSPEPANGAPPASTAAPPVPDRSGTSDPATELFEPANGERTQYLPPADERTRVDFSPEPGPPVGSDIGTSLEPEQAGTAEPEARQPEFQDAGFQDTGFQDTESRHTESRHTESRHAAPEPSRGLFQPALPSVPPGEQEPERAVPDPAPPEPAHAEAGHDQSASEALLPKRQRRDSPLGGFDPPEPIQPSMRAVTRREPVQGGQSGSLFEPGMSAEADPQPSPVQDTTVRDSTDQATDGAQVGPFGPGSAMPLAGGERPSEDFAVKASVTTLRYCPPESDRFPDMVAEVWFRSPQDAERVGFRPIG